MNHLGSTEVARLFGVRPRDISDLYALRESRGDQRTARSSRPRAAGASDCGPTRAGRSLACPFVIGRKPLEILLDDVAVMRGILLAN